jgi:hypothetical protein
LLLRSPFSIDIQFNREDFSHLINIHSVINRIMIRHSCESRNPGKHWIPGQARNDKKKKTYVVLCSIAKDGKYVNIPKETLLELL